MSERFLLTHWGRFYHINKSNSGVSSSVILILRQNKVGRCDVVTDLPLNSVPGEEAECVVAVVLVLHHLPRHAGHDQPQVNLLNKADIPRVAAVDLYLGVQSHPQGNLANNDCDDECEERPQEAGARHHGPAARQEGDGHRQHPSDQHSQTDGGGSDGGGGGGGRGGVGVCQQEPQS